MSTTTNTTPNPASSLPPRKRARTEAEKEQRRVERIIRNRKAAHASREKKRKHVEHLESYVKALEENLSQMYQNQSMILDHLKSIDSSVNFDLVSIIERPDDLLSSEDENLTSDSGKQSPKKQKLSNEKYIQNDDEEQEEQEEHEEKEEQEEMKNTLINNQNIIKEVYSSPMFSSISSPSHENSEYSNPSTPSIDYTNDLYKLDSKPVFSTFSDVHNNNLEFNDYFETDVIFPNSLSEFDDILKPTTESNNMGCLGMFNSVHSAVMHIY